MWINTETARQYGVKTGDLVELSTFRPYGHDMKNGGTRSAKPSSPRMSPKAFTPACWPSAIR